MAGNVIGNQFIGPTPGQLDQQNRDRIAQMGQVFNATMQSIKKRQEEAFWKQLEQRALDDSSGTLTGYLKKDSQAAEQMFKYLGYRGKKLAGALDALKSQKLNIQAQIDELASKVVPLKAQGIDVKIPDEVIDKIFSEEPVKQETPSQQQQAQGGGNVWDPANFVNFQTGGALAPQGTVPQKQAAAPREDGLTISGIGAADKYMPSGTGTGVGNTIPYSEGGAPNSAYRTMTTEARGLPLRVPNPGYNPDYGVSGKDRQLTDIPNELSSLRTAARQNTPKAPAQEKPSAVVTPVPERTDPKTTAIKQLIPDFDSRADKEAISKDFDTIMAKTDGKIPKDRATLDALRGALRQEEAQAQAVIAKSKEGVVSPKQQAIIEKALDDPDVMNDIREMTKRGLKITTLQEYQKQKIQDIDEQNKANNITGVIDVPKTIMEKRTKQAYDAFNKGVNTKALMESGGITKTDIDNYLKPYADATERIITFNEIQKANTPEQIQYLSESMDAWMQNPIVQQSLVANNPQAAPYFMKMWEQKVPMSEWDKEYERATKEATLQGLWSKAFADQKLGEMRAAAADFNGQRAKDLIAKGGPEAETAKIYQHLGNNITKLLTAFKGNQSALMKNGNFQKMVKDYGDVAKKLGLNGDITILSKRHWYWPFVKETTAEFTPDDVSNMVNTVSQEDEQNAAYEANPYLMDMGLYGNE